MHVQGGHPRIDGQILDAGFLGGFAQRRGDDVGIGVLAMSAELQPPAEPWVQGEQRAGSGGVENQRRRGDMTGHAVAPAGVRPGEQKGQHRMPQGVLGGIGCLPTGQKLDR